MLSLQRKEIGMEKDDIKYWKKYSYDEILDVDFGEIAKHLKLFPETIQIVAIEIRKELLKKIINKKGQL